MIITSIVPAIKVTRENDFMGMDCFIEYGDVIKIKYNGDKEVTGKLIDIEWGTDEEDDMLYLQLDNNETFNIGMSFIEDILTDDEK